MRDRWRALCGAAIIAGFASLPQALAQEGRVWVDPPSNLGELPLPPVEKTKPPENAAPELQAASALPPLPPPRPEDSGLQADSASAEGGQMGTGSVPRRRPELPAAITDLSVLEETARQFAIDYLAFWSSKEVSIRDAVPAFYAPRVEYYGRTMNSSALIREKTRFARRWPDREYSTRPESIQVHCDPADRSCAVHSLFDFRAENKRRRRKSEGRGVLELVITFEQGRPQITSENGLVQTSRREARRRPAAFD
ncbi:hypothetical protein [Microvirga massiliensis]|uniref:hypothetical protein n=1 Tax=Microvirga massiliensis TaxID=1033741 RepID=UPI000660FD8B|nr:hypothetical protein [Microvirga massiliensis]